MSLKYFIALNVLLAPFWFMACMFSLFFWENAGNPLTLLILIGIYGGVLLSITALVISIKNFRRHLYELGTAKYWVLAGSLAAIGECVFLIRLVNKFF
jgi:uncharacterized integral membrane protein